jgi:hypothetical protein
VGEQRPDDEQTQALRLDDEDVDGVAGGRILVPEVNPTPVP